MIIIIIVILIIIFLRTALDILPRALSLTCYNAEGIHIGDIKRQDNGIHLVVEAQRHSPVFLFSSRIASYRKL